MSRSPARTLAALERLRLRHGPGVAEVRLALLRRLERTPLRTAGQVRRLHELLCFARAYPDDVRVLRQTARMLQRFSRRTDLRAHRAELYASGIAGTTIWFPFFYPTARWVAARWPRQLLLDRNDTVAEESIAKLLPALMMPIEAFALRESHLPGYAALDRLRGRRSDATFLLERIAAMPGDEFTREAVYDALNPSCELLPGPTTPSRTRAAFPVPEVAFRSQPLRSGRPDLRHEIARAPRPPHRLAGRSARELIDLARASMATRERDLDAIAHGNPLETWWIEDDAGLAFVLFGMVPERRPALPAIYGGLTLQNGVPIGYHQSDVIGPCVAVSFNTFDTFRGGASAFIFARLLATLHTMFGATSFSIEPYQLGEGNDEGIESGAWWFYAKLGFRPRARPALQLAAAEARRLRRNPMHRSSEATLRQLARHHLFFDFDPHRPAPLVLPAAIGLAVGSFLGGLDEDRDRALHIAESRARAACGLAPAHDFSRAEARAWRALFPLLAMLPARRWAEAERAALVEIVRNKAARSERDFVRSTQRHARLLEALARLSESEH
ncbi:MAG TPA: hypothetical protein VMK32_04710 [Burkholderiaceae bacterium]|nr:hypothetical protein [Burkholderiaceae bacterium]